MNILFIVGSLRAGSYNAQLAKKAAEIIGDRAEVSFLNYGDLPYMNQDLEYPAPFTVQAVRAEVEASDGIWIFTPEYNHSYSGVLKNLIDWLSRPIDPDEEERKTSIAGKKVAISGLAGKSAAEYSRRKLAEMLDLVGALRFKEYEVGIAMSPEDFKSKKLSLSEEDEMALKEQAESFLEFIG